jgi:hypothetical protein
MNDGQTRRNPSLGPQLRSTCPGAAALSKASGMSALVGINTSLLDTGAARELIRTKMRNILERRNGSLPMSDLVNEDSELKYIAARYQELVGKSLRRGYILRAVEAVCQDFLTPVDVDDCNQILLQTGPLPQ